MAMLEARGLALERGGRCLFENLEFDLEPGDTLLLTGPNGSGKSSLLRLLGGFTRAGAGQVRWNGVATDLRTSEYRCQLHYVGHSNATKSRLTVGENLEFMTILTGGKSAGNSADPFSIAGLANRLGRYLSAGQKRRLALTRLAASFRPIWLLDEPGVGLDRSSRQRLQQLIGEHRDKGGICIVASHGDVALADPLVLELGR